MSIKNVTWARSCTSRLASDRLVLHLMADAASEDRCWLSVASLAERAQMSPRNARYCLRRLERDGWITPVGISPAQTIIYALSLQRPAGGG